MYHVELRQFPHNSNRFNLTAEELHLTILDAWTRGDWIDFGERKWSPHQATLTVLEGPEIPLSELSIGRGWSNAKRHSTDVTAKLLAAARQPPPHSPPAIQRGPGAASPAGPAPQAQATGADAPTPPSHQLAAELLALLGPDPTPLLRAWQLALERHPDRTPAECLSLAEDFLRGSTAR